MLLGIWIGQRTPGHSTEEAVAFERGIHQRYVDYINEAGWDYFGVYAVEGLVPGAFAEFVTVDAPDVAQALRLDAEHEAPGVPADVVAFYSECRDLFWQRGSLRLWLAPPAGWRIPVRGESVRLRFEHAPDGAALAALAFDGVGEPPAPAVAIEIIGNETVEPTDELLAEHAAQLPERLMAGSTIILRPLVPAPLPSRGAPRLPIS